MGTPSRSSEPMVSRCTPPLAVVTVRQGVSRRTSRAQYARWGASRWMYAQLSHATLSGPVFAGVLCSSTVLATMTAFAMAR